MARIEFRAKVQTAHFTDEAKNYDYIRVPELDRDCYRDKSTKEAPFGTDGTMMFN